MNRFRLTIAYVVLAAAVMIALSLSWNNQQEIRDQAVRDTQRSLENQQRIERQSAKASRENCLAINESRDIIRDVIVALARPETRDRIFERIDPLLKHNECPPIPEKEVLEDDGP